MYGFGLFRSIPQSISLLFFAAQPSSLLGLPGLLQLAQPLLFSFLILEVLLPKSLLLLPPLLVSLLLLFPSESLLSLTLYKRSFHSAFVLQRIALTQGQELVEL